MLICAAKNTDLEMEVWIQSLPFILLQKILRLEAYEPPKVDSFLKKYLFFICGYSGSWLLRMGFL